MKYLTELSAPDAKVHLLKSSSYFRDDLPEYLSFDTLLTSTARSVGTRDFNQLNLHKASRYYDVNYKFLTNKDGRYAWRPYELIHPVLYVALVNALCQQQNWLLLQRRFRDFANSSIECCSLPVLPSDGLTTTATQVRSWWQRNEQRSLEYSMEFSHLWITDVTDCYGSLYTHSIPWALHGKEFAKFNRDRAHMGNLIDDIVRAGRHGQTNGVAQGTVLLDLIAELVLGHVDQRVSEAVGEPRDFRILRYRDDYRVFTNSDERAEQLVQVISRELLDVGMKLGVTKTQAHGNVVHGSIKPDKMAGIGLSELDFSNAMTMQKQLLRLHAFGQTFPNSGGLKRLVAEFHERVSEVDQEPDNVPVCVAIATDIGFVSPTTFPAIAGILSHLLRFASVDVRQDLWQKVRSKMMRVPHNGYLEVWLQRVTSPKSLGLAFDSDEPLCQIAIGKKTSLWESGWVEDASILAALDSDQIRQSDPADSSEQVAPDEVSLFRINSLAY